MTVREAIKLMKKYNQSQVITQNGTRITIHELSCNKGDDDIIGNLRFNKDGSLKAIRRIFCWINPSDSTKMLDELKRHKEWYLCDEKDEYSYFSENEFLLPERVMNQFISYNDGIDEYETIQVPMYMYTDTMAMIEALESTFDD